MENQPRSIHPIVLVAAISVTIASLVAIASFAGWIPVQNNDTSQPQQVATAPVSVAAAAPIATGPASAAQKGATQRQPPAANTPARKTDYAYEATPAYNNRGATPVGNYPMTDSGIYVENSRQQPQYSDTSNTCRDCATVESVREVKQDGEGTGLGAIAGGLVGGLLGNQIGGGSGKTVGAVVGAAGGAYAGHQAEKNVRGTKSFEITVRLEDGNTRVFKETQQPSLQRGDRVRISNGQLSPI